MLGSWQGVNGRRKVENLGYEKQWLRQRIPEDIRGSNTLSNSNTSNAKLLLNIIVKLYPTFFVYFVLPNSSQSLWLRINQDFLSWEEDNCDEKQRKAVIPSFLQNICLIQGHKHFLAKKFFEAYKFLASFISVRPGFAIHIERRLRLALLYTREANSLEMIMLCSTQLLENSHTIYDWYDCSCHFLFYQV